MENEQELISRIALTFLPNVGPVIARALYRYCGSADAVFREKKQLLEKIPGVGAARISKAFSEPVFPRAEQELKFIRKHGISVLFFDDDNYPQRLRHCHDAPALLYFKGNADLNSGRYVAVVGTRSSTSYGEEMTRALVQGLVEAQVTIVSGLAYGIDICSHEEAIRSGMPTIAVTAHGLDRIYPHGHRQTAKKMLERGGLLTEYPSGTTPDRENFPSRNRIVAGMCDAVVVVEATGKGGALITADLAQGYDRDVFAFPGRATDSQSKGCNDFIRENKAALLTSADDLLWMMGWKDEKQSNKPIFHQTQLFLELDSRQQRIVEVLRQYGECGYDAIAHHSGLSFSKLSGVLLELELKGVLKLLPGKRYRLN